MKINYIIEKVQLFGFLSGKRGKLIGLSGIPSEFSANTIKIKAVIGLYISEKGEAMLTTPVQINRSSVLLT
jgi:hypothetical protein